MPSPSERSQIMFFSGSKHTYPGTGSSESLTEEDREKGSFDALHKLVDFRKKMSNFWPVDDGFLCRGRRWRTVEHCFQGAKFENEAPEYAAQFSLDSSSALSQGSGGDARRAGGRKAHPLSQEELARWDVRKWEVMKEALYAKYSQVEELREILLATGEAELLHRPPRSRLVVEHGLMEVRTRIREESEGS